MITQQEMDDLAVMANGCLLPIVNAAATQFPYGDSITTAWDGANPYYDKFTQGIEQYIWSNCDTVSPQPPYSFTLNPYLDIVPSGATYGADVGGGIGNYSVVVSDDGSYDFIPATTGTTGDSLTDGSFSYIWPTKCFYLKAGTYVMSGAAGQPVNAVLTKTQGGWMQEINRMRGDAMALTGLCYAKINNTPLGFWNPPDNPLKLNPEAVCSGPWCVGVNDLDTWPLDGVGLQGQLISGMPSGQFFKNVEFWCDTAVASGLAMSVKMSMPQFSDLLNVAAPTGETLTFNFLMRSTVTATVQLSLDFNAIYGGSVNLTSITGATVVSSSNNHIVISMDLIPGDNPVAIAANGTIFEWGNDPPLITMAEVTLTGSSTATVVNNALGVADTTKIKSPQYGTMLIGLIGQALTVAKTVFTISDTSIKGIWIAKTLPVPGENVFIDQDMPPYVGKVVGVSNNFAGAAVSVAVAGNGQSGGSAGNPLATTMRQTAPISFDLSNNPVYLNGKIQSVSPGITARPAKWLVRRDTDFVPFELGFNSGLGYTVYSGQIAPASGDLVYYNVSVPPNATKVLIRLVQPGTVPGWKAGVFQYGDALSENLTIIVKESDYPTSTVYDFTTTNNAVTIDPDGGGSYLETVLNNEFDFAVVATNGNDVAYDCYVEIDTATPQRVYFPPVGECFSDVINGTPGVFPDYTAYLWGNFGPKPIPQSGYCIFKVRATRLPTDNGYGIAVTPGSGAALTVTVGQNVLAGGVLTFTPFKLDDGVTNLTVTIPADGRDSGDVKVFIPVLSGNELVYQCSAQVIFEAWANWQPIFFNNIYGNGQFPIDTQYYVNSPVPTVFQYALNFANDFNITRMGWPQKYAQGGAYGSEVQFPLFRELYDDLVALLKLLGGVLPGGDQAGGAGGTGSAGDGGSTGDDGGGSQL